MFAAATTLFCADRYIKKTTTHNHLFTAVFNKMLRSEYYTNCFFIFGPKHGYILPTNFYCVCVCVCDLRANKTFQNSFDFVKKFPTRDRDIPIFDQYTYNSEPPKMTFQI